MAEQTDWPRVTRTRLTRRRVLGTGALTAASLAVGCARGSATKQTARPAVGASVAPGGAHGPQPGGVLNVLQQNNPATLDAQRTASFYTSTAVAGVQSRLLQFKTGLDPKVIEQHEVESDLALSVESPDGITWTVKLRPDAKFHDIPPVNGHAVEAEDIKATFVRALGRENPNNGALAMIDPTKIETPAKDTVIFRLNYPYSLFNATLASPSYAWIFPREIMAGGYDPAKQLIGSGPFILESYTPDVALTYKRNLDWFQKGLPYVDAARCAIIPDTAQELAQFTGGHIHVLGGATGNLVPNDVDDLKKENPRARVIQSSPDGGLQQILWFQLGNSASPFQDIRLRRAFSMAIDRQALAKAFFQDRAEQYYYVFAVFGKWALKSTDLDPSTAQYFKYNPAETKKLLAAAGAADRQFKFIYFSGYPGGAAYTDTALANANMLKTAGVNIQPVQLDYQKDYQAGGKGIRYGNFPSDEVIYAGMGNFTSVDDLLYGYWDSESTNAISALKDSTLDSMIGKARATLNENDTVKAYLDVQRYLVDKVYAVVGFYQNYQYTLAQPQVENYQHSTTYGSFTETYTKLWLSG